MQVPLPAAHSAEIPRELIDSLLGHGATTLVFSIQENPQVVLRIPIDSRWLNSGANVRELIDEFYRASGPLHSLGLTPIQVHDYLKGDAQ